MSDTDKPTDDYLNLRDKVSSAQIATLDPDNHPSASHAPVVWVESAYYLFLSDLSSHARHLQNNPLISLVLLDDENSPGNAFARKRIMQNGTIEIIAREKNLYAEVLKHFHERFGEVMELLESLADFRLYRVNADGGRFIRGFGQAYDISGDRFDQLTHVDPRS